MREIAFLWVNFSDLSALRTVGGTTFPLMWVLMDGDDLLPGVYTRPGDSLGDTWVIVKTTSQTRAEILTEALNVIANAKGQRRLRTRITVGPAGAPWKWIPGE